MSSSHEEFVRSITARIEAARNVPGVESDDWHVVFLLGGSRYALPMSSAREILRTPPLTPVPGARGYVQGIFSHRGKIIPVVDLAKRFQDRALPERVPEHVIVLEEGGVSYGFLVDRVIDAKKLDRRALRTGAVLREGEVPSPYLLGFWEEIETETVKPFRYEFFIAAPKFREEVREETGKTDHPVFIHLLALSSMVGALEADALSDIVIQ